MLHRGHMDTPVRNDKSHATSGYFMKNVISSWSSLSRRHSTLLFELFSSLTWTQHCSHTTDNTIDDHPSQINASVRNVVVSVRNMVVM
jgi:hypothetical protein